jgi:eukaryotic-like serine/threonine-protein kinase
MATRNTGDDPTHHDRPDAETADLRTDDQPGRDGHSNGPIPERIGQYAIRRVIASGGMGTVFEALQDNPSRPVALKVVKGSFESREAMQRLEYETQILARLRHPGIAQIYDAGSFEDRGIQVPYFAMEYIPNARTITEFTAMPGTDSRRKLELFLQVCDAVHHGHQRGIVHRDLKPSNILVDSNGRVRVIDFGVARATGADILQASAQTQVGQLVGTVQYMSPEQFDADPNDIDTRSDVYALGLVLYELLAGRLPYGTEARGLLDLAQQVREGRLRPVDANDSTLGGEMKAIVHKALNTDREHRYQSAFGLAQDIRRYLSGEAVEARPARLSYQLRVFGRRNKALIGLVSTAFLLLVCGVVVATTLLVQVDTQRQRAEVESARATAGREFLTSVLASAVPHGYGDKTTVADVLDHASEKLSGSFDDEPEVEAELRHSLGMAYLNVGHWTKAEQQLKSSLTLRKQTLGMAHDKTMQSAADLRLSYDVLGDARSALDIERDLAAVRTERAGDADPTGFLSQRDIALLLEDLGELEEAQLFAEQVWKARVQSQGKDSETALSEQAAYAWLLMKTGRYERAEGISVDGLAMATRVLGKDHRVTLDVLSAAAAVKIAQGKIGQARELYGNRRMPAEINISKSFQGQFDATSAPFQFLVFFEEWCPFSQNTIPKAETIFQQYRSQGLDVIGFTEVSRSSTDEAVQDMLLKKGISFAALKESGRLWNYFNCSGTPSFRLLHEGYLIWENRINTADPIPLRMVEGMLASL